MFEEGAHRSRTVRHVEEHDGVGFGKCGGHREKKKAEDSFHKTVLIELAGFAEHTAEGAHYNTPSIRCEQQNTFDLQFTSGIVAPLGGG